MIIPFSAFWAELEEEALLVLGVLEREEEDRVVLVGGVREPVVLFREDELW